MNWDNDTDVMPAVTHNFVAPGPTPAPLAIRPRVEVLPPEPYTVNMPTPAAIGSQVRGSYLDRAQGFRHAMTPVAVVAGVLGSIAAVTLFGVPVLSFAVLMWFFTVFCTTWLVGYALHVGVSADGAVVLQVLLTFRLLRAEQKARLRRMERDR